MPSNDSNISHEFITPFNNTIEGFITIGVVTFGPGLSPQTPEGYFTFGDIPEFECS